MVKAPNPHAPSRLDQVVKLRLFVAAPAQGEERTDLDFTVRATDSEGGTARDASVFERPEEDD